MEKIIEYIEGAKGAFVALGGVLLAIIKWYDRISSFTSRNFKRFMGTSPGGLFRFEQESYLSGVRNKPCGHRPSGFQQEFS